MNRTPSQSHQPQLEYVPPGDLHPHPDNPRKHPRKQIKQIAKSIEAFGFRFPVLVDKDNRLIAGHGRIEAAKQLGLTEVPVLRADDLTDAQAQALRIADNRLTETSEWDDQLLGENLKVLSDMDLDFDIEAIGFDYGDIEHRIGQLEILDEEDEAADDLPSVDQYICQRGDVWLLGDHRVICGDSTVAGCYQELMGHQKASLIFTDPPYNLPARAIGKVCDQQHGDFAMASGEMPPEAFTAFLESVMGQLCRFSVLGSIHYLCMDWRHAQEMLAAGTKTYTAFKNLCVWVKDRPGMGSFYRSQHELVFVFKNGGAPHQNNFELGQHGRNRSNVWEYCSARSMKAGDGDPGRDDVLSIHPTVKPVSLVEDALLDCSRRGEIVLEPFLGSGSTLIACEKTQRRCYGIEIEPRYLDVTIQRWQAWTGEDAVHAVTCKTYAQTAADRGNDTDSGEER